MLAITERMGLLFPGTHLGERREWLAAWLGNQAFLPQCGKVEVGVFWSRCCPLPLNFRQVGIHHALERGPWLGD